LYESFLLQDGAFSDKTKGIIVYSNYMGRETGKNPEDAWKGEVLALLPQDAHAMIAPVLDADALDRNCLNMIAARLKARDYSRNIPAATERVRQQFAHIDYIPVDKKYL